MDLKAAVEEPRIYTNSMTSYRYEKECRKKPAQN